MCARQDGVGVVTEGVVEFVARALQKDLAQRFGSAAEMLASLEHSLTTSGVQRFDLFISYRVWCDKDFAQALFRAMSASAMRGGREFSMRVYLDKVRLLDGQRFDIGFIRGLAASTVFAPLLSAKCIEGFLELEHTDREDFVLMEWLVALELQRRGIIKAILPISIGDQGSDGTFSQSFFEELRDGKVGGRPLPDVVSHKTTAKAQEFLGMLEPPLALSGSTLSVKGVVMELLKFQAVLLHFENDTVTKKVQQIGGGGSAAAAAAAQLVRAGSQPLPPLVAPLPLPSQRIALSHAATVCAERAAAVVLAHGAVVDQAAGTESDAERLARDKSPELRVKDLKIKQLESQLQKQSNGSTVTIPEGLPPQQVPEPEPVSDMEPEPEVMPVKAVEAAEAAAEAAAEVALEKAKQERAEAEAAKANVAREKMEAQKVIEAATEEPETEPAAAADTSAALAALFESDPEAFWARVGEGCDGVALAAVRKACAARPAEVDGECWLELSDRRLGDGGAAALGRALENLPRPLPYTTIGLARNGLGPTGVRSVAHGLRLGYGDGGGGRGLEGLYLGGNRFGGDAEAVRALAAALPPTLKDLRLPSVSLGDAGLGALLPSLRGRPALELLELSKNQLGAPSFEALGAALPSLRALRRLGLHNNRAGSAGVRALAVALPGAPPSLATLRVQVCGADAAAAAELRRAGARIKDLQA
jgi:hypothetical protein